MTTRKNDNLDHTNNNIHRFKIIIIFFVFLILPFLSSIIFITVIYPHQNFIRIIFNRPKEFHLPKGKFLYDLNTVTYNPNHSIFQFQSKKLILDEHDEEAFRSFVIYDDYNDLTKEIFVTPHVADSYEYLCTGICNCVIETYDEELRREKWNMLTSFRFWLLIGVGVLAAVAVDYFNESVNECVEHVRTFVNAIGDEDLISCTIEKPQCDLTKDGKFKLVDYTCIGVCTPVKKKVKSLQEAAREENEGGDYIHFEELAETYCRSNSPGEKIVSVPSGSFGPVSMIQMARTNYRFHHLYHSCVNAQIPTEIQSLISPDSEFLNEYPLCSHVKRKGKIRKGSDNVDCFLNPKDVPNLEEMYG